MKIAFIGGGNMATALIGGLLRDGCATADLSVVEPDAARRSVLQQQYGIGAITAADQTLRAADVVVLAVKPQQMRIACEALRPFLAAPLIVSVAAGIRSADIGRWLGTQAIVRSMPNTPALIGQGMTGMAATASVSGEQRARAEAILRPTGTILWFEEEDQLDAVTALSGSGPAYVFYFIEALQRAGRELGLSETESRALAVQTFVGAAQLAAATSEPISTLRERVTSKGGTTAAALARLQASDVAAHVVAAVHAAHRRSGELGDEFGRQ